MREDRRNRPPAIIQALPGFDRADCYSHGGKVTGIEWQPIVAWRVTQTYYADAAPYDEWREQLEPITVEGVSSLAGDHFIVRYPDGRILEPDVCGFESEAQLIEYFQEALDREEQLRAQRAAKQQQQNK